MPTWQGGCGGNETASQDLGTAPPHVGGTQYMLRSWCTLFTLLRSPALARFYSKSLQGHIPPPPILRWPDSLESLREDWLRNRKSRNESEPQKQWGNRQRGGVRKLEVLSGSNGWPKSGGRRQRQLGWVSSLTSHHPNWHLEPPVTSDIFSVLHSAWIISVDMDIFTYPRCTCLV